MIWLTLLLACNNDKPIETDTSATNEPASEDQLECETDTDCNGAQICESNSCVDGDRNNSIEEAQALLWDDPTTGFLNPAGDEDFYSFTSSGGEYIRITTTHNFESGDTVVTLRSPTGQVVAWSDDYPTGSSISTFDSAVYALLVEAGDYVIEVEDANTYYGTGEDLGSPLYEYTLTLEEWSQHTDEPDSESDSSVDLSIENTNMWNAVGVNIQSEGDADYILINISADSSWLYIAGMADLGSSDLQTLVRLYDSEGTLLSEKEDVGPDGDLLYPQITPGDYLIEISDANGGGGDNHWGFFFIISRDKSTYETESEPNDNTGTATVLSLTETQTSSGSDYSYVQAFGTASGPNDIDWYSISNPYGADTYIVGCLNSNLQGSLLLPTFGLYDSAMNLIAEVDASSAADPNAAFDGLPTVSDPLYYLKVESPSDAQGVAAEWYQLTAYIATFEPDSYSCP